MGYASNLRVLKKSGYIEPRPSLSLQLPLAVSVSVRASPGLLLMAKISELPLLPRLCITE